MKLRIKETVEQKIYVDLIKGGDISDLQEDIIDIEDEIKNHSEYTDIVDTRKRIAKHLQPLADKIKKLHFIDNAYVHAAGDEDNEGLSNYVRIVFSHPYGISDEELQNHYYYTIRFSDHKHVEAEEKHDVIESYEVVGTTPKELIDVGWEIFEDYIDDIKLEIKQHEIDTYGYQKTTL